MDGDNQEVTLYDKESKSYLFGKPVFHKASYIFRVSSHEDYYYNKISIGDNIVVDQVPTQGGDLKITNEMNQETAGSATLDDTGVAEVKIEVNNPDISGANGGLKKLDFAVGSTTAEQLVAYVLGSRSRGSSFVSAGPIRLMNILRDPPGSHSYSYCEKGRPIPTTLRMRPARHIKEANGSTAILAVSLRPVSASSPRTKRSTQSVS